MWLRAGKSEAGVASSRSMMPMIFHLAAGLIRQVTTPRFTCCNRYIGTSGLFWRQVSGTYMGCMPTGSFILASLLIFFRFNFGRNLESHPPCHIVSFVIFFTLYVHIVSFVIFFTLYVTDRLSIIFSTLCEIM